MLKFGLKKIIRLYKQGNVSVSGLTGRGKDLLMSNVVVRRKLPYISNMDYGGLRIPLNLDNLMVGGNTFENFINNDLKFYEYPYCDKADIYLSDCGVYFPCQYNAQLNKKYGDFSVFMALSRHLGEANIHTNCQALGRVWDKIREQSDIYILCENCVVLFHKLVIQNVIVYDKCSSAEDKVKPCCISVPIFASQVAKQSAKNQLDSFRNTYGSVRRYTLVYFHKSKYDTRKFKGVLLDGKKG